MRTHHVSPSPPALLFGFDIRPGPGCTGYPPKPACQIVAALATNGLEVDTEHVNHARVYIRPDGRVQYEGELGMHTQTLDAAEFGFELFLKGAGLRLVRSMGPAAH